MAAQAIYVTDLQHIDWQEMKSTLAADAFDNGRTPEQLQASFENSYATVIAYINAQIVGTARVLSDGVCNAYIVDVWTLTQYRRRGIATAMMQLLLAKLEGQHVYLFTDDAIEFYEKLGFEAQPTGLGTVVGQWLGNNSDR
ncbi:GNAT family N-acetyltransferase [Gloeocapsopsis dulcis]|uniref:GNAT family N-acetyltransferase n=1 Tax=Gloeocapsopsis dulcis AAB1 = 1H9 TaxID=1433147 RepID=A0A6N8FWR3_9CHRO|nr:GNAT family N-acetyltransferase [Gloeocapsopsis dulcis]MUL37560.1 GNAT family N-acetyltransferase [Gloeocapsopsis dulcis AAB1 = 1H9]WNN87973.1 GNAT family N-acetyltransferase [Gloeocapsopsis dulcis]